MENQENFNEVEEKEIVKVDFQQPPKKEKKENFLSRLVYTILAFVMAIAFIVGRNEIFGVLGYIVGVLAIVMGAVTIIAFLMSKGKASLISLIWGILEIMAGIYCVVRPFAIANLAIYVFAIIIFISGIVLVYFALRDKQAGFKKWIPILIFGIVMAILGLAMLFFVSQSRAVVAVMVGISLFLSSVFNMIALILQ